MTEYSVKVGGYVYLEGSLLSSSPDMTCGSITVSPPVEPGEGLGDAVLGDQHSEDVSLCEVVTTADETVFLAKSSRDDPNKPQHAQQRRDIRKIGARLGRLLNNPEEAAKMTVEMPFADTPAFDS